MTDSKPSFHLLLWTSPFVIDTTRSSFPKASSEQSLHSWPCTVAHVSGVSHWLPCYRDCSKAHGTKVRRKGRGLGCVGHVWEKGKVIETAGTEEAFTKNQASFLLNLEVQVQGSNKVGIVLKLLQLSWHCCWTICLCGLCTLVESKLWVSSGVPRKDSNPISLGRVPP